MFLFGIILGIILESVILAIVAALIFKHAHDGDLRIDDSIEEDPTRMFLELHEDVQTIRKRKYVIFKVINENYIPRD